MRRSVERKSEAEMLKAYPIAGRLPNWYFRANETSANAWLVEGSDVWGRTVARQGANQDELLTQCVKEAAAVTLRSEPISYHENRLFLGSERLATFDYSIVDAYSNGRLVIVLLNYGDYPKAIKRCKNLFAIDLNGQVNWAAQLPTQTRADAYYKIASHSPLVAYSVASYECEIDPNTGRIQKRLFYK
ncbi:MAG: hypothetical protein QNJ19_07445 [Woeseiaceae bacterium]|nr:hypothetical protein [Woeseiaceae bacterium]